MVTLIAHAPVIVDLSVEEVRTCTDVAVNRWFTKFGSKNRKNYETTRKEHELLASVRTIVAEYAVAKAYRKPVTLSWYPNEEHIFRSKFADVEPCYEVRTMRTRDELPVFPKDIRPGVVIVAVQVLDPDYYSRVKIFGWKQASECNKEEWWRGNNPNPDYVEKLWRVPLDEFEDSIPQW